MRVDTILRNNRVGFRHRAYDFAQEEAVHS